MRVTGVYTPNVLCGRMRMAFPGGTQYSFAPQWKMAGPSLGTRSNSKKSVVKSFPWAYGIMAAAYTQLSLLLFNPFNFYDKS